MPTFLSADVGGTKTLLRLSDGDGITVRQQSFPSAQYVTLSDILDEFLRGAAVPAAACLAVAGPVDGRRVRFTNLPWDVDADQLQTRFGIARIELINDFKAVGLGIAALQADDLVTLQAGTEQPRGARLAVGAGTGLGVAFLSWQGEGYAVHPSEGGHLDFAPADELQIELLRHLQTRYGHVSWERLVSGPGIVAIHDFLRYSGRTDGPAADEAAQLTQRAEVGDTGAAQALDLFVSLYGAYVGNAALLTLPRGGIYLAGGIAAKILSRMQSGEFLRSFLDKGRYAGLLTTLPLHIVIHPNVGMLGATQEARRIA
ncbi:MAG: glucokinase [Nitrosomonadales bacterium]|nr:glucokinase [Nitrosomonadales bacterium]